MSTTPLPSYGGHASVPPLPTVASIAALAKGASFEMVPADLKELDRARSAIPPSSTVSITWLPGDTHDVRVRGARAVHDAGFEPLPHICARRLHDEAEAFTLIRRLHVEAGVERILLLGGDSARPVGEFRSALELLARLHSNTLGLTGIGFGGYPEGSPRIGQDRLDSELDIKLAVADDAGLDTFVITQFAFEARPIIDWLEAFRRRGHGTPVQIGLAGPAAILALMRFARSCGVGASVRQLGSNGASIARMLAETGPDGIIRALAENGVRERLGPVGLHLFPFGALERAARWMAPVSKGRIRLGTYESGFTPLVDEDRR